MTFGVDMKRIGWAIALAAAFLTPAAAMAQAQPSEAAAPSSVADTAATQAPAAAAGQNQMAIDQNGTGGAAQVATTPFHYTQPSQAAGEPIPGGWSPQFQVTQVGQQAANFHDRWLLFVCALICALVLVLLATAMIKFRRGANPVPSRTSHNTLIEVVWTVVPVLVLVAIAIPSIRLMRAQYAFPKADVTVKVIGNQWYWTYQYPDNGGLELVSNILKEKNDPTLKPGDRYRTDADGPPLLAADERMVIPAGKVVKFLVTSNDVIHSFAMPAFWTKIDANPGQINETWVKVDRPGVYFGQCSELCGARHGFMPIAIDVVPPDQFAEWIHSKGGTMPSDKPAVTPAALPTGAAAPAAGATPAEAQPNPPTPSAANRATNNG
jgi:cytochrome c oxidase subunit 2